MSLKTFLMAGLATSVSATKLLVSGYGAGAPVNGSVLTLELSTDKSSLKTVSDFTKMGPQPTWLDTDLYKSGMVLGLDEAWATEKTGGLYSLKKGTDGTFNVAGFATVLGGPVSTQFYNNNTAVAIAHYGAGAISTFKVSKDGALTSLQNITYPATGHGPAPAQTQSRVHQALIDPTGQYLVFNDLGLDAIHVFCIDPVSGKLTAHGDIKDTAGSGPRHGVFWKNGKDTYYFLVHELSSMITSFKVEYLPKRGLGFTKVDEQSSYGNKAPPAGAAAAEIQISPCGGYVLASNRNVTLESIANPDTKNATKIESDSIVTFKTSPNGKLKFHQLAPSGGKFPRHFSLNKDGSMVAVANQQSYSVDLYARDINTGMMGKRIASAFKLTSNPNNVNFVDE